MADFAVVKGCLGKDWDKTAESDRREKIDTMIALAATTKLEWQIMHALCELSDIEDAIGKIRNAETKYSSKYKLVKAEHVHHTILKKRDDLFKKHSESKQSADRS